MIPDFNDRGLLPPGVHLASWDEMVARLGTNPWRQHGSFVTNKNIPNDYDACWEEVDVDPDVLDPVLLTFDPGRATQKAKYLGELFPASVVAGPNGLSFLDFFQTDGDAGERKGIIAINLEGLT